MSRKPAAYPMFLKKFRGTEEEQAEFLKALPGDAREDFEQIMNALKALEFHPRAAKLMAKRKNFIVIADDEPYFKQAYDLIRFAEDYNGKWTEEDECKYQEAIARSKNA